MENKKYKMLGTVWNIKLYQKIKKLSESETNGSFSAMARKLCTEALKKRGESGYRS
jgi:hypothetical protein